MKTFDHHSGAYFNTGNAQIYYEEKGNKGKPVVLMLHGGFGTMEDFNPVLPGLSEKFHVIGVDSRGQGKSTLGDRKLTYQQMQDDIEALLDYLGIDTVHIIGFSDGGMVAYRMGISSPVTINRIVAIDAPWSLDDLSASKEILSKVTPASWKEKFPASYNKYLELNPATDFEELTRALKEMWLDAGPSGGYHHTLTDKIACPLLIVRGDKDPFFSRKSAVELADSIKNSAFLNICFAEHESFKDQPEIFNIALQTFLDK